MHQLIDLSICIENGLHSDPPPMLPKISYTNHDESFGQMAHFFPGLVKHDLPGGEAWAVEHVELSTHNGTHLDAPYHFASTMDGGEKAITVDDIQAELKRIGYEIKPFDIVLVHTSAGKKYGTKEYLSSGCGMGKEATLFLLEQGVKITGTDAWSWDASFVHTAARYAKEKDPSIIWEGHKAGRSRSYCHLEKLHNLDKIPSHGFMISCFPVKIKGASAGWTRAVAVLQQL